MRLESIINFAARAGLIFISSSSASSSHFLLPLCVKSRAPCITYFHTVLPARWEMRNERERFTQRQHWSLTKNKLLFYQNNREQLNQALFFRWICKQGWDYLIPHINTQENIDILTSQCFFANWNPKILKSWTKNTRIWNFMVNWQILSWKKSNCETRSHQSFREISHAIASKMLISLIKNNN